MIYIDMSRIGRVENQDTNVHELMKLDGVFVLIA